MSYFHPERMPVLPPGRRHAARLQLEQVVARSAKARRRSRPAVIAAVMAIVMLSTGAAAAGVVAYQAITDRSQALCFTVASADAGGRYYTTVTRASKPATRAEVNNAVTACRELFAEGELKVGQPVVRSGWKGTHRVPHLIACALPDGTAAIFPARRVTCEELGLTAAARR